MTILRTVALAALLGTFFLGAAHASAAPSPLRHLYSPRTSLLTFGDGAFSVSISPADGRVYALRSLQPAPTDLLGQGRPLGLYGVTPQGRIFAFNHLRGFQVIRVHNRPVGVRESLDGHGLQADLVWRARGQGSTAPLTLQLTLTRLARSDQTVPQLIFLGQPNLPTVRTDLYAYPYSRGLADTGGSAYLRLGPSWSAQIHTTRIFAAPCAIETSFIPQSGDAGLVYALQPATGHGYYLTFRQGKAITCWKNTGKWVTKGDGLGGQPFPYTYGKMYRIKIVGGMHGFQIFVNDKKLFDVHDTQFTRGALGLSADFVAAARYTQVRVSVTGKTIFHDDFSGYRIDGVATPNWSFGNYGQVPGDVTVSNGGNEWGGFPAQFVDLPDRFLVWGQFDLNHPMILNHVQTDAPWVAIHLPAKAGDTWSIHLFMKTLPRPQFMRRSIIRWYAERMYSSDPLFPPGEPRLHHRVTRTLPSGNTIWYMWGLSAYLSHYAKAPPCLLRAEARAKTLDFRNIVLLDWYDLSASAPPDDPLPNLQLVSGKMTFSDRFKQEITRWQKAGFRVYLYFWPLTLAFNPHDQAQMQRYVDFIKACVNFYQPNGVGYDMNWNVSKKILNLQYEVYTWLKKKHPADKVIVDYGYGTPSELEADALLCEKTPVAYGFPSNPVMEAVTALRATLLNLIYFQDGARTLQAGKTLKSFGWGFHQPIESLKRLKALYVQLVMKSLALGAPWMTELDDFVARRDVASWTKMEGCRPFPFPELLKLRRLARFSAMATGTPLVTNVHAVASDPDLAAACWAKQGRLLIAAYRYKMTWHPEAGFWSPQQEATSEPAWVSVTLADLHKYGLRQLPALQLVVLDKKGLPVRQASIKMANNQDLAISYPTSGAVTVNTVIPFTAQVSGGILKISGYVSKGQMLLVYPRLDRGRRH